MRMLYEFVGKGGIFQLTFALIFFPVFALIILLLLFSFIFFAVFALIIRLLLAFYLIQYALSNISISMRFSKVMIDAECLIVVNDRFLVIA